MQNIELGRVFEYGIWLKRQPVVITDRSLGQAVHGVTGVRQSGEHLVWTGEVDLVHAVEDNGPDLELRLALRVFHAA